jgi:uncharacterized integral membrane protein
VAFRYLLIAVLASAVTVFALQNNAPTSLRFLAWSIEAVPLATVILASVATGIVLAGIPLVVDRWRLRSRNRALESRLAAVEAEARHGVGRREAERAAPERREAAPERREAERREAPRRSAEREDAGGGRSWLPPD